MTGLEWVKAQRQKIGHCQDGLEKWMEGRLGLETSALWLNITESPQEDCLLLMAFAEGSQRPYVLVRTGSFDLMMM